VWGNGQFTFTDFSDHVAFSDKNYPHYDKHGGYLTPRQMLSYYIHMIEEIPGYVPRRDQQFFYRALSRAFFRKNRDLRLESGDTPERVVQKIWKEGGMAYQVFDARRVGNYIAEGALHEFDEKINEKYSSSRTELALKTEKAFTRKFHTGLAHLEVALSILRSRMTSSKQKELIDRGLSLVAQGDLITDEKTMNAVYQEMTRVINYDDDQKDKKIRDAFSYLACLSYVLNPVKDYLEHEEDVVSTAKASNPSSDTNALQIAEQEIKKRIGEFGTVVRDPHALYQLLTNPKKARRMITFHFYTDQSIELL
jgi:hypothetical protein